MSESINVENKKQNRHKPPLSFVRIAGEIIVGMVTSAALAYLFLCVVRYWAEIADLGKGCMDFRVLPIMACFVPPIYALGCAIGVYLVGSIVEQTGSFLPTLGCGFLGGLVMALLAIYIHVGYLIGIEKIFILGYVLLIGPIAATLGFNLTRRYKKSPSS